MKKNESARPIPVYLSSAELASIINVLRLWQAVHEPLTSLLADTTLTVDEIDRLCERMSIRTFRP